MNSNGPFEDDKSLRKILSEWHVNAALPPRFQEQVWKRIEDAEMRAPNLWTMIWVRTVAIFNRPAFAVAYLAMVLLIGAIAGHQQGQSKTEQVRSDMQARYVQMVDPYKIPR
ncbi:MAG TPA: hypothetical protein VGV18_09085 [Verrucomicrobiae bacterium]|nr:hypothetical protein [Verrucomicrobiae bacterium]